LNLFCVSLLVAMADERTTSSSQTDQLTSSYMNLHISKNPVASLVSPVLDSSNYHSWICSIMITLNTKNKVEFIIKTNSNPVKDHSNYSTWNRCNNMVVSWLVHSVSLPIQQIIIWMDVVMGIWNDLKTRYSQGDLSRIYDLQLEVAFLNQGDLSVTEYFTKLRIIWEKLDNFRHIPICTCFFF